MILNVSFGRRNYQKSARNDLQNSNGSGRAEHDAWVRYFNSHLPFLRPSEDGDTYEPQCADDGEDTGYDPYSTDDIDVIYNEVNKRATQKSHKSRKY